jgi:hypothetical protein
MGHKGKNVRKAPKEKTKPVAPVNQNGGAVSSLTQPAKANAMPFGHGGMDRSGGSKKNR